MSCSETPGEAPKIAPPPTALDQDHEFDQESRVSTGALSEVQIENLAVLGKI